jgi:hypothetical protein
MLENGSDDISGTRRDTHFINLSMMSYTWFDSKRELYPELKFPGTHLVPLNSVLCSVTACSMILTIALC